MEAPFNTGDSPPDFFLNSLMAFAGRLEFSPENIIPEKPLSTVPSKGA
jgi:hypothetical protein